MEACFYRLRFVSGYLRGGIAEALAEGVHNFDIKNITYSVSLIMPLTGL